MLLQTKFHIPTARTALIARPALLAKLRAGQSGKVTLVSAPAGFGKTTLVAEWLRSLDKSAVAWLSLDKADNDPTQFMAYLVSAMTKSLGQGGRITQPSLPAADPSQLNAALVALLNELSTQQRPLLLTLDDYHLIDNQAVHEILLFLIEQMPPRLHLTLITRTDPPLPLARWRVRREINEIRSADLRFTAAEAATFLNQIMGLQLTADQVATLEERTEGWVASLQLAALSLQREQDVDRLIAEFSGGHRHILDYLTEEALQNQPPVVRDFLLKTSVLERLTAPLCDLLTNRTDSQAILTRLEQANLFLTPLDHQRRWYRYHHLFADLLRRLLHTAIGDDGVSLLHSQAARWFAEQEQMDDAIHHALAAKDYHLAADLIVAEDLAAENRGTLYTLVGWYKALPEAVLRQRPKLTVLYAHKLMMIATADDTETMLNSPWLAEVTDRELQGEILVLRGYLALDRRQLDQALVYAQTAQELLTSASGFWGGIYGLQGHIYFQQGQLAAAEAAYSQAATLDEAAGRVSGALDFYHGLARVYQAQFRHQEAEETLLRCLKLVEGTASPTEGNLYMRLAWNHSGRAEFASAERQLRKGLLIFQKAGATSSVRNCLLELVYLKRIQQDLAAADVFWRMAQELPTTSEHIWGSIHLEMTAIEMAWAQGDIEPMRRWLQTPSAWKSLWPVDYKATACQYQVLIAASEANPSLPAQLFTDLGELLTEAEARNSHPFRLFLLSLRALGEATQGQRDQALQTLQTIFDLAHPFGYQVCFLQHGKPMLSLLQAAVAAGVGGDFAQQVLQTFQQIVQNATQVLPAKEVNASLNGTGVAVTTPSHSTTESPRAVVLIEPLTDRETEVLALIGNGLNNQAIADQLVISIATVKRHISNLYGKLGVEQRTQALARARELGLL